MVKVLIYVSIHIGKILKHFSSKNLLFYVTHMLS